MNEVCKTCEGTGASSKPVYDACPDCAARAGHEWHLRNTPLPSREAAERLIAEMEGKAA